MCKQLDSDRSLVFDLESTSIQKDPFAFYPELLQGPPVRLSREHDRPVAIVSRYEVIEQVLKDPGTYSSMTAPIPMMLLMDPPRHTELRRSVAKAFTPRAISAIEPVVTRLTEKLYYACLKKEEIDIVENFAGPLTVAVIGNVLGVPVDETAKLRDLSNRFVAYLGAERIGQVPQELLEQRNQLLGFLGEVIDGVDNSSQTIIGILADLHRTGELDRREVLNFCALLFVAGHETTTSLISQIFFYLVARPSLMAELQKRPDSIPNFIEETLRTRPPLHRLTRITSCDTQLSDVPLEKGTIVSLIIGAANLDERKFSHPEDLDLTRGSGNHLSFGKGIHACIGAPLARLEARIATEFIVRNTAKIDLLEHEMLFGGTMSEFGFRQFRVRLRPKLE